MENDDNIDTIAIDESKTKNRILRGEYLPAKLLECILFSMNCPSPFSCT